jgi:hypothetical protein
MMAGGGLWLHLGSTPHSESSDIVRGDGSRSQTEKYVPYSAGIKIEASHQKGKGKVVPVLN